VATFSNASELRDAALGQESGARLQRLWLAMLTRNLWPIAVAVGAVMFVASVGFDFVLLKHQETPAAIVISNGLVALLAALLVYTLLAYGREQRRRIIERMEALNEVNHHIRNALQAMAFTEGALKGTKEGAVVSESIQRIQWALLEVLPKVEPTYEPLQGSARQTGVAGRD
jgi:uncharacterized integral membrane protein